MKPKHKSWPIFTSKTQKGKLRDLKVRGLISKYIVKQLGFCLAEFFSCTQRRKTKLVKKALALLGDKKLKGKPHYKVYANGLSPRLRTCDGGKFVKTEWLYDLHWYTEVKGCDYQPTGLPLVVECEWEPNRRKAKKKVPYSGIKFDFQKLLVANASLRLMIFIKRKHDKICELDEYFNKAIESFRNLEANSKFLFIAFDEEKEGFYYAQKVKGRK
jgi:hypothetical protein